MYVHSHIYIFNNFKVVPFIGRASLLLASADSGLANLRQSCKLRTVIKMYIEREVLQVCAKVIASNMAAQFAHCCGRRESCDKPRAY